MNASELPPHLPRLQGVPDCERSLLTRLRVLLLLLMMPPPWRGEIGTARR